jgi:murein L,D-transpeptidase YafK
MIRLFLLLLLCLPSISSAKPGDFVDKQKRYPRVRKAFKDKEETVRKRFTKVSAVFPPKQILLRVFKKQRILQLWAKGKKNKMVKVYDYPICSASGGLGPKRKQGDEQVPEGFYYLDRFNPRSNFFLSLGLNYPNRADKKFSDRRHPGGDIFIHGDCVSIGCVAITDSYIKEVYLAAVYAKSQGQRRIPVHIFPTHLDEKGMRDLKVLAGSSPIRWQFWKSLQAPYLSFEKHHRLPKTGVSAAGHYYLKARQ